MENWRRGWGGNGMYAEIWIFWLITRYLGRYFKCVSAMMDYKVYDVDDLYLGEAEHFQDFLVSYHFVHDFCPPLRSRFLNNSSKHA